MKLRRDLLEGRKFTKAVLHAPRVEPVSLELRCDDTYTTVKIPELGLWAVLELTN